MRRHLRTVRAVLPLPVLLCAVPVLPCVTRAIAIVATSAALAAASAQPAAAPKATSPAGATATSVPTSDSEVMTVPGFGRVTLYAPPGTPAQVVLFISGDGGWNLGVVPMAQRLRDLGALVVGIDIRAFVKSMEASANCAYPAGALEELSRAVQLQRKLPEYKAPILVGYSSGATLVYAALVAAPSETFAGAVSLGFCPDLEMHRAPCQMRGLKATKKAKGLGYDLAPFRGLDAPWMVLQGDDDQVCSPAATRTFVAATGAARLFELPQVGHGFGVPRRWEPQFVEAYRAVVEATAAAVAEQSARQTPHPPAPSPLALQGRGGEGRGAAAPGGTAPSGGATASGGVATSGGAPASGSAPSGGAAAPGGAMASDKGSSIADLQLTEVPAISPQGNEPRGRNDDALAIILTGDGGWRELDRNVAARLAAAGVPTVGWSSLRYYWTPRTPDGAAADLARIVTHYTTTWNKRRVLLIGYSFGADTLPFVVGRLPASVRERIAGVTLLGPSKTASFEFHLTNWLGGSGGDARYQTIPEIQRLAEPVLCVHGSEEQDSPCPALKGPRVTVAAVGRGHHFSAEYDRLAAMILGQR